MKGIEIAETKQEGQLRKYGNRPNEVQSQSAILWVAGKENSILNAAREWKIIWSLWNLDQSQQHNENSNF